LPTSLVVKNGSNSRARVVHARPGVRDREAHVLTRRNDARIGDGVPVHVDVRRLDREHAPVGHRIARVHSEIEQHLLELAAIGLDPAEVAVELGADLDVVADHPPEHLLHVVHDLVQVDAHGLEHLLPAEGEELTRQSGGAVGRLLDLLQVAAMRVRRVLEALERELAVARDRGH
jgi:hypothetical protein